jgi:hypothetical protein
MVTLIKKLKLKLCGKITNIINMEAEIISYELIEQLVKDFPNDMELGKKIREIVIKENKNK